MPAAHTASRRFSENPSGVISSFVNSAVAQPPFAAPRMQSEISHGIRRSSHIERNRKVSTIPSTVRTPPTTSATSASPTSPLISEKQRTNGIRFAATATG